jgi:hypothetical protein
VLHPLREVPGDAARDDAFDRRRAREVVEPSTEPALTGVHAEGIPISTLRRQGKRAHNVYVGEVAATFLALEDEGRARLLGVEVDEKRIGTSTVVTEPGKSPLRVPLVPDAPIALDTDAGPSAVLVEVDMATTAVPHMAAKYAAYLR